MLCSRQWDAYTEIFGSRPIPRMHWGSVGLSSHVVFAHTFIFFSYFLFFILEPLLRRDVRAGLCSRRRYGPAVTASHQGWAPESPREGAPALPDTLGIPARWEREREREGEDERKSERDSKR